VSLPGGAGLGLLYEMQIVPNLIFQPDYIKFTVVPV
jgi:hypothetical protein